MNEAVPGTPTSAVEPVASTTHQVPEEALTDCIQELRDCVVLRNEEDLFGNLRRGGDIDLLVRDLDFAEWTLSRHLGLPVRFIRS